MSGVGLPGWFGKLPGMGDFAHRRLPEAFRAPWDQWLQHELARLRERHADWVEPYLQAPLWSFALGPDLLGAPGWAGVLMPSVDSAGRYFPFTLVTALADTEPAALLAWWQRAAQAALQGLDQDLDAARFEALLPPLFVSGHGGVVPAEGAMQDAAPPTVPELPNAGESLWFADPADAAAPRMRLAGLPRGMRFDALFGWAEEVQ